MDYLAGEILLINKPYRWTSFDVIRKLKNKLIAVLNTKKFKIGHAGTLDPLATGLLIVCTGKFTKKIDEFQALEKEYTGTIVLGATTPSFDLETEVDQTFSLEHVNSELIYQVAKSFVGEQEQVAPIYSAKKINGERAYNFARRGENVEIKSNKIKIFSFEVIKIDMPTVEFKIICSKGTYIRAIARDFGKALDTGAHLSSLCRTRIGSFTLEDALSIEEINL